MRASTLAGEVDVDLATDRFLVVDVETTGWAPPAAAITEIAAVLVTEGRTEEAFSTLVNPGMAIPRQITRLTGISDAMVADAPPVEDVLDAFLERASGTVLVGHNLGFDLSFLNAAIIGSDRAPLTNPWIDTLVLARDALGGCVPNFRLATLATFLDLPNKPAHRAMCDALATADLLQALVDRLSVRAGAPQARVVSPAPVAGRSRGVVEPGRSTRTDARR